MLPYVPSPALVQRVLQRRGRLHPFDPFEAPRCALLVVDMQNSFVQQGAGHAWVPGAAGTCEAIEALARSLRAAGGTVVWVLNTFTEASVHGWSHFHENLSTPAGFAVRKEAMRAGATGHALYADLHAEPQDLQVLKTRFSAFIQGASDLHVQLQARGVDTVFVAGTATNVCCESTARDAMMLNYRTVMVSDGCSAFNEQEHAASLDSFLLNFGDVQTSAELIAALGPSLLSS
jgi:ureidoacrylate peracid hydrolase